jgi:hypothetical protein
VLKEYAKFDKKKVGDDGKIIQSSKFKKFVHKTMSNNMVSIDVGYESFLAPEMFFHPVSLYVINNYFRNLFIKTSLSLLRR